MSSRCKYPGKFRSNFDSLMTYSTAALEIKLADHESERASSKWANLAGTRKRSSRLIWMRAVRMALAKKTS